MKNRLFGIIERMREIKPMWYMCRILRENGAMWSAHQAKIEASKALERLGLDKRLKPKTFQDAVGIEAISLTVKSEDGRLLGDRSILIFSYIKKYCPEIKIGNMGHPEHNESILLKQKEIGGIIELCVKDERKFMDIYEKDMSRVYLTRNGEDFSDGLGLVKEYIRAIGPIWGGLAFVVMAVIAIIGWFK